MTNELISRRLRIMLTDYLSSNSVLREIENEFEAEGVRYSAPTQAAGGQRRTMVQGYLNNLDLKNASDARKFLNVLAVFIRRMEIYAKQSADTTTFVQFTDQLTKDGYTYKDAAIHGVTASARLADAKSIAQGFDAAHMSEQIQRIEASIDTDPALAIGTAKELTESCFKTILGERGVEYAKGDDLPQLGRKVFKELKLLPDDVPDAAKGADSIKRLLSNLATVVQGLAEIRGLYGTGHGKDGRVRGVSARHARLCVGAASALVTFAFQTHLESKPDKGP
ncbi:MAG: abortive infection family protein [Rhizomicrobium sp.]